MSELQKYNLSLNKAEKRIEDMGLRRDSWIKYKIVTNLRLLGDLTDREQRSTLIENVTELLKDYVKETGQYLGPTISESLTALLGEILLGQDQVSAKTAEKMQETYEKYIRAADGQPFSPPLAKQRF